jgi:hypothetical protein
MPKPHRVLLDRVSSYADEAGAFMRRRRLTRRPFARVYYANGQGTDLAPDSDSGAELFAAAAELIELAGRPRRSGRRE